MQTHDNLIVDLNEQNFQAILENSTQQPLLIHFWAPSITESTLIIDELKQLANQNSAFTLALLNCEQQSLIARQFGVQTLPTIALFSNRQAVDGMAGPQSIEAVKAMLAPHLPSQEQLTLQQAQQLMAEEQYSAALVQLQSLSDEIKQLGEVKLAIAKCLIETTQFDLAAAVLEHIPLEYQQSDYQALMAKLTLHQQAADSPEIQQLQTQLDSEPNNSQLANTLALQYHQTHQNEQALSLLWSYLDKDLNCNDGELKKTFISILTALGQGNPLATQYRRRLYSRLY